MSLEGIAHAREAQAESPQRFVEGKPGVLRHMSSRDQPPGLWRVDRPVAFHDTDAVT
jgi:hypothetical protein